MTAWRIRLDGPNGSRPVLLEGDASTSRGALVGALQSVGHVTNYVYVDGERWTSRDTDVDIASSNLRNGSLVSESGEPERMAAPGTYLVVVGGPGSGHWRRLEVGLPVVLGRDPGPGGVKIDDALLSGEHLSWELDPDGNTIVTDLDSKNGSLIEEQPLDSAVLERGCVVHAGASLFMTVTMTESDRATVRGSTPTGLNLHRQFREALTDPGEVPERPTKPRRSDASMGSAWWRSLMPLVTAIGFAVMFGRWQFLLIAAFAPIVYAIDNQRRKRAKKREAAEGIEAYEARVARYEERLAGYMAEEVRRARTASSGGGMSAMMATFRHRRVWERLADNEDFLDVTLGFAGLPARAPRRAASLSDEDDDPTTSSRSSSSTLWKAPLSIALNQEGPLSITGPMERAGAVARSLLVELVFAHAPIDVNVWVLSTEHRAAEWQFVQWLPHAFTSDGGARLGVTATGRSSMVQTLLGLIEARREDEKAVRHLPVHVVVIDGVDGVTAVDLATILGQGPAVGVVGIVTDESVVPEGVRGEVQLGRFDDECTYRSVLTPRVDQVTVSQVSHESALQAALALAPLEPFNPHASSRPVGTVFFTDMVDFRGRSAEEQAEFWTQHSPRSSVPVGVSMDGQPFMVDVVRHGPHGLIGGMTRSGKTEFLKTWFSSLALHNHPDDLAIAIIDFKGGVDHRRTAKLPHVVALATNQNIDLFERTVGLLTAELKRRQTLFDGPEVSTLEGYRTARAEQPGLIPIPRLIVVVDEFVELLETQEGKDQLGRLESIARIGAGLGVHLLLVTQRFDGSLPPQIDGQAGLRICFKVQKGDHGKIVIDSTASAGISSSDKGRAFARFMGGDLLEFQSARVGNKARDAGVDDGQIVAHFVTHDTLVTPPAPPEQAEVPDAMQDLYRVVDVARRAANVGGDYRPAVPWPAELEPGLEMAGLADHGFLEPGVVGVSDDPDRQRVLPVVLSDADPVVALVGATASNHHEALLSMATASALAAAPDDLHIYGIDLVGRGLSALGALPHVGTVATRDDATAIRILTWLMKEAASRRAVINRQGAADFAEYRRQGGDLPRIQLFVLGADRLFLHGEGTTSPLLTSMVTVVNEIAGTGIQVVFTGTIPMLVNKLGTTASRRFVFAATDVNDYPASVNRSLRSQLVAPLFCVDSSTGLLTQIARLCAEDVNAADVLQMVGDDLRRGEVLRAPRRFSRAPWPMQLADIDPVELTPPSRMSQPLPLGVSPETGEVIWVDPEEDGYAFRIIGAAKSGRSNALAAIGVLAERTGWNVLSASASRRSPLVGDERFASWKVDLERVVEQAAVGFDRPTLLLVDEANRLDDDFPWKTLSATEGDHLVTVIAGSTEPLTKTTGIMRSLNAPNGVVMMPLRAREAGGVGVTIDEDWVINPLAGVGVAGVAGEAWRIQFPLVTDPSD